MCCTGQLYSFVCLLSKLNEYICLIYFCFAAPIDLQCPNYMEIEVNQWASVVVNASGTEPIGISTNVPIGSFSPVTVKQDVLMATGGQWNIHGNDKGLAIGSNVTVQWTASYNNTPCTPIEFDRLVLVHCEKARKPVQCNSTIFVYSEFLA